MKILLTAINAKFIHSSLAVRSIAAFAARYEENIEFCEYTINNEEAFVLKQIYEKKPDVICFSCYIWNINMVKDIADSLKKVLPKCKIVCGGPEVSYDSEEFLKENKAIDMVLWGEGEKPFLQLAQHFIEKNIAVESINNLTYKNDEGIFKNTEGNVADLDEIPFVYNDLSGFENKIIYYETQRGCPYSCQFCLSSVEKGVRFLSDERMIKDLKFFLDNKVKQVKFVDRTFNCNKDHALKIWRFIMANDNGYTNFHMEIEAHIITDDILEILKNAREGLFQFEIGVQSTNNATLEAVRRNPDFEYLKDRILKIKENGNIHVHLDLIAGLPFESYDSFKNSFNDVYSLFPQQLQLGFLKLLKGSGLRRDAEKYGIVFNSKAPYEVLCTKEISFDKMLKLKEIESLVETYYNSGKTVNTEKFVTVLFKTPFYFYEEFALFWKMKDFYKINHSKNELYEIFYEFCSTKKECKKYMSVIAELLTFDMLLSDNIKKMPEWCAVDESAEFKAEKRQFFNDKSCIEKYLPKLKEYTPAQLSRMCRIEKFDCDIMNLCFGKPKQKNTYVLFNYYKRDIISNKVEIRDITEEKNVFKTKS